MTHAHRPVSGKSLDMFEKLLGPKSAFPEKPDPIPQAPKPNARKK